MEILKIRGRSVEAVTRKAIYLDGQVFPAGSSVTVSEPADVDKFGGMANLIFPGIPALAEYQILVGDFYRDARAWTARPRLKPRRCEYGDLIELTDDQAQRAMLQGRARPTKGSQIPDLSIIAAVRYRPPVDLSRAVPLAQQRLDRQREMRRQADEERARFAAAQKKPFASDWRK